MVEVQALSRYFGDFCAVNQLSFQVKPGEVLGFLGPNGAGKSTTMKMITGFLAPSSGQVRVCGYDLQTDPILAKANIGYLPEGAPCYDDMTVWSFLNFIADVRQVEPLHKPQRLDEVIRLVELQEVLHQRIETLSKGFKRRVGLAQAIIHNPRVLVLDEPTDGLDPNQKHQVRKLIQGLAEDKIIIISTHILEEVTAVCTRAMIIARGRLILDGTPAELEARSRYHGAVQLQFERAVPASEALSQLNPVASVEQLNEQSVRVLPKPGKQIFADVQRLAIEKSWPLTQINVEKGHLDEVFRRVTKGEEVA